MQTYIVSGRSRRELATIDLIVHADLYPNLKELAIFDTSYYLDVRQVFSTRSFITAHGTVYYTDNTTPQGLTISFLCVLTTAKFSHRQFQQECIDSINTYLKSKALVKVDIEFRYPTQTITAGLTYETI